jgi:dihydrofolate reductase
MKIALVAAVARGGAIGVGGTLPWRISDDLKWFKKVTAGKPIIMGRKTFTSIGRALPGRDNIVATRQPGFAAPGAFTTGSLPEAITLARGCAQARDVDEICVIGGAEIYAQTLPLATRIYLTRVNADIDGDVHFPDLKSEEWSERRESACEKNARNDYGCEFFMLERRSEKS